MFETPRNLRTSESTVQQVNTCRLSQFQEMFQRCWKKITESGMYRESVCVERGWTSRTGLVEFLFGIRTSMAFESLRGVERPARATVRATLRLAGWGDCGGRRAFPPPRRHGRAGLSARSAERGTYGLFLPVLKGVGRDSRLSLGHSARRQARILRLLGTLTFWVSLFWLFCPFQFKDVQEIDWNMLWVKKLSQKS